MKYYDKPILECYIRLYKNANPSGNFDELMKNATVNENGDKEIPMDEYYLCKEEQDKIIEDIIKEFKIEKMFRQRFRNTINLGCSPRYIRFDKNE